MAGVAAGERDHLRAPGACRGDPRVRGGGARRQHPAGQTAVLLLRELVTNSVRHSASGLPGRTVTVTVLSCGEVARVQVTDRSGATVPALRPGVSGTEGGGRGLYLVDCVAARWVFEQDGDHTTTWFELQHR
jgi:anti-sigma regulatory factor (Ser/Thr protein kinase)